MRTNVLTERQKHVATLAADGYTMDEIGAMLNTSPRTIKATLRTVRQKLGVQYKREIGRALREIDA